jgi:hypothetical protein
VIWRCPKTCSSATARRPVRPRQCRVDPAGRRRCPAPLRHRARYLSALNENRFSGLKLQTEQLAMARTPKNCRRSFATTSAANCACWKRRAAGASGQ